MHFHLNRQIITNACSKDVLPILLSTPSKPARGLAAKATALLAAVCPMAIPLEAGSHLVDLLDCQELGESAVRCFKPAAATAWSVGLNSSLVQALPRLQRRHYACSQFRSGAALHTGCGLLLSQLTF